MSRDRKRLEVSKLTAGYGGKDVLKSLDMTVADGRICGLIGPNGSGKTTLLDVLYGILPEKSGEIRWDARSLSRSAIGYLEAENYFYPLITGREYLELFRMQNQEFDVGGWCKVFDLPLDQCIDAYSQGMKKKLALIGVLALDRPILLLDEPLNHLDLESNQLLQSILRKLAHAGKTIVLTSHILASLTKLCDDILFLLDGKIAASFSEREFAGITDWLEPGRHRDKKDLLRRLLGP